MVSQIAEAGLNYEALSVNALFGSNQYYNVPRYQRNYSWGTEEVRELLTDLTEAHDVYSNEAYLLGQIIVCPTSDRLINIAPSINQMDLIDGQQRCTTLYLLILTATKLIKKGQNSEVSALQERKNSERDILRSILSTNEIQYPRIRVASNGDEAIAKLLDNHSLDNVTGPTQTNIKNAVEEIESHLQSMSPDQIDSFLEFVLHRVYVVRLSLISNLHALRIFQKVNNRGLELDNADLIKNYLFQNVSPDEFIRLSELWEQASQTIFQSRLKRVKSMEFLMKLLIGIKTGNSVPTGSLYDEWTKLLKTENEVQELANKLPSSASNIVRISKGIKPATGQKTDLLLGSQNAGWIQQYEILLAGSHLVESSYDSLCKMVEDRTMLSYWSKEPSQEFERIIHKWAKNVSNLDPNASVGDIKLAGANALENFDDLCDRAFLGLIKLDYRISSHKDRIRYILARVNQKFQSNFDINYFSMTTLMQTTKSEEVGFDIDHIYPKSPSMRSQWQQSKIKDEKLGNEDRFEQSINSLGNLTLLHNVDNNYQSDSLPWEDSKIQHFASSELLANRILIPVADLENLSERISSGFTAAQNKFPCNARTWDEEAIDSRAQFYWEILRSDLKNNLF